MDASHLSRALKRRVSVVAIAAVGAAVLTVVLTLLTPQQYRGTADVVVPLPGQFGSPIAAVGQAVSDFEGALRSDVVAARVGRAADVPPDEVAGGLSSEQLFGGTVVEVRYVADDPATAESVAGSASREALVFLLEARRAPLELELGFAESAAERAETAYASFIEAEGLVSPEAYFRDQQARITRLVDEAEAAENAGDEETAAELQARADRRSEELAPVLLEYRTLSQASRQAQDRYVVVQAAFGTADAAVRAAEDGGSVEVLDAVPISRGAQLARRLLIAVVVATALAIATIVLLALLGLSEPQPVPSAREADPSPAETPRGRERLKRRRAGETSRDEAPGDEALGVENGRPIAPAHPAPPAADPAGSDAAATPPGPAAVRAKRKRLAAAERQRARDPRSTPPGSVPPSGDADGAVG